MNDGLNNNNEFNNIDQNDYYNNDSYYSNNNYDNNDSYYSNNNYDNNYSDAAYEEKEKKNGIWWKILLVILVILIIIFLLLKFCGSGSKKTKDDLYVELTSRLCTAAENYIMSNPTVLDRTEPGRSTVIKFKTLSDANLIEAQIQNPYYDGGLFKQATQQKYYSMDSSIRVSVLGDGTLGCEIVDNSKDVTAPELRLNGDSEITLALGTEFEDPGYTATDDYDGDITNRVVISGNVDSTKAGKYELTYTVQDSAGNVATLKRTIVYEEYADIEITMGSILDGVTPQISLKGANPYCMVKGTKYVEPGAVATDNVDGNITNRISVTGNVTGNLMGAFRLVYKVEDSSGNQAVAYRAVIVTTSCPSQGETEKVVNNKPTITLIGKNAVTISRGSEYIDLGATAYDKEDGDITNKIVTDVSGVKVNSAGIYKVIYRVTDSSGVTVSATRTVTVKDSSVGSPVVRFTEDKKNISVLTGEGNDSLLKAPKAVNENGVPVAVSYAIEDYNTKKTVSKIDWSSAGKYRVVYTAVHGNGTLKQAKSIVVTINNDVVTIGGKNAINVTVRSESCDITEADLIRGGVTFTTSSNKTAIVSLSNSADKACKLGTHEITVTAKVDNGPEASKKITVYVVNGNAEQITEASPSKVVITGNTANPTNVYNTNDVWVGGDVTGITLTFQSTPAANTEIAYFEWSTDCAKSEGKISKSSAATGILAWNETGASSVCIRAITTTNVVGEWSEPVKLNIDRTGPSVKFTHTWADGKEDWHNSPSMVLQYDATDSESGLSHFEYTYDDVKAKKSSEIVSYNEATGKLTVSENTEPSRNSLFVYVRAVDKAGNKGEWTVNPAFVNIDTVKPNKPTLEVIGNNTPVVKLKTTFTDGKSVRPSGFGKLIYTLDEGEEKTEESTTITMPANNTQNNKSNFVKVWAVDKAGNRSDDYSSTNVTITPAKIAVKKVILKNGTNTVINELCAKETVYPGQKFTLTATPSPSDAHMTDVVWSVSNANIAVIDENGNVSAKNTGTATITAKIGDKTASCNLVVKQAVCDPGYTRGSDGKCTPKTISVTFNSNAPNGGTETQTFTYGVKGNKFGYNTDGTLRWGNTGQFGYWDRAKYKLLGWSTNPKDTKAQYAAYSDVNDDWIDENSPKITLYAIWEPKEKLYSSLKRCMIINGKNVCCDEGYDFDTKNAECILKTITVTFNKNDGSGVSVKQTFTYGVKGNTFGYNNDGTPKWGTSGQFGSWDREGYTLLGWAEDSNAKKKTQWTYGGVSDWWIDENAPSIELYAIWEPKTVEVTFNSNMPYGGTVTQNFTYGVKGNRFGYNNDGTPKWGTSGQFGSWDREGYTLLGWAEDPNAKEKTQWTDGYVSDSWINKNSPKVTLYAVWQKKPSTGGSASSGGSSETACTGSSCRCMQNGSPIAGTCVDGKCVCNYGGSSS